MWPTKPKMFSVWPFTNSWFDRISDLSKCISEFVPLCLKPLGIKSGLLSMMGRAWCSLSFCPLIQLCLPSSVPDVQRVVDTSPFAPALPSVRTIPLFSKLFLVLWSRVYPYPFFPHPWLVSAIFIVLVVFLPDSHTSLQVLIVQDLFYPSLCP